MAGTKQALLVQTPSFASLNGQQLPVLSLLKELLPVGRPRGTGPAIPGQPCFLCLQAHRFPAGHTTHITRCHGMSSLLACESQETEAMSMSTLQDMAVSTLHDRGEPRAKHRSDTAGLSTK